jgi:DNA replication protein DnaC
MSCHCPRNASHGDACQIVREFRMTPAQRREAYHAELRARAAQLGSGATNDTPWRLSRLGVPADAIVGLRGALETKSIEAGKRFVSAPRDIARTLLLSGPRGAGKTVAAAWVMAQFMKRHDFNSMPSGGKQYPPFVWCSASEVTAVTDWGRVDPDWLDGLKHAGLLVLDDLGEDGTAPGVSALADVLKLRHEKRKPTVITTNLPVDAAKGPSLRERYGDSWFERLKVAAIAPNLTTEKSLRRKGGTP